ncbi:MAG: acyl-CoA reductase [Chitinophagales bacterium]|nr:acyl-CoA reductase [Chitinophagales bacterium]
MSIPKRISLLSEVAEEWRNKEELNLIFSNAFAHNGFFEPQFCRFSFENLCDNYLSEEKLLQWLKPYHIEDDFSLKKRIGIICAGNIPFAGFHDFLCCYVLGIPVQLKLSSKDTVLMRFLVEEIIKRDREYAAQFAITERLQHFDAVIASGSTSANRYFEYYFGKYPNILRGNRTSVAVLEGTESEDELRALADDIFLYFGLGCRNVGKIFLPKNFEVEKLLPAFSKYAWIHQNTAYMNNYDYNRAILLINQTPHIANEFVMLQESEKLHSPVATVYYEFYENRKDLINKLSALKSQIQCVVGNTNGFIPLGGAQKPSLNDYADEIDTIAFILSL